MPAQQKNCTRPNGIHHIGPHIKHCCPAEELHKSDFPEGGWCVLQQRDPVGTLFLLLFDGIIFGIFLRIPLLDFHRGVEHTEDEDGGTAIERPDDGIGHDALRSHVLQADPGEDKGEEESYHRTGITEKRLNGIGFGLLLLVDHIAHQHLEGLHRHVDTRVEQHECHQSEDEGCTYRHSERAGIGQQAHDSHSYGGSSEQIRYATTETGPGLVTQCSNDRLHQDSHQRGEYPEKAQRMGVSSQRTEDSRDVSTLQRIGDLHTKETKTQVP